MNAHTPISRLAWDTLSEYANCGQQPPDLVVRAHIHRYVDSMSECRVRAIIQPPFCTPDAYAVRKNILLPSDVGAILVYCDKGRYEVEPILYHPKRREWQKL